MPKITYIAYDGTETQVDADEGMSVMQAAVNNGVAGIVAECGGACSCATCHVHIDQKWSGKLPEPQAMEKEMLGFVMSPQPTSRLGCQVKLTAELDGMVVYTPESQY